MMLSWGEDSQRVFGSKHSPVDGACHVHQADPGRTVRGLCAGHSVLSFIRSHGNAFIIRTHRDQEGGGVRGKPKLVKWTEKIRAVSCGDDLVSLLTDQGSVLCVDSTQQPFTPRLQKELRNIPVRQVACGSGHTVALTNDGRVYTWGQDSRGQLGLGEGRKPGASTPQHLRALLSIPLVQVAAGGEQSFALSVSGGVFGWGRNDRGQLGLGDTTDRRSPAPVECLNMKRTVHISCGRDHTAILTKDAAVFTFGSGQYGQLGHNSFRDELRPRLVAELLWAKVTEIACGRYHTLVLTDAKKVYSFGCGEQGQLGHGDERHPSVPLPVQLPQGPKVKKIFAGGNCSFAMCSSDEEVHEEPNADGAGDATQLCLEDMIDKWTSKCDSQSWEKVKQEIHRTFSTASCLNRSFLEKRKEKHFHTSATFPGLDLPRARLAFKKLAGSDAAWAEVEAAVLKLLLSSYPEPVGVEGLRMFLLLNELLHAMQKIQRPQSTKLAEAVAAATLRLSDENLQVIGNWWTSLSASTMSTYVKVWKKALSVFLSSNPVPGVRCLLQVLQYMYNANCRTAESKRMPDKDFYLHIHPSVLVEDLKRWHLRSNKKSEGEEPLILCKFPIVMDLQNKKMALDMYAKFIQEQFRSQFLLDFQFGRSPVFILDLRRAAISEDTFKQLDAAPLSNYKKPLTVYFDKNFTPSYVYLKDFFHEIFHELVSKESKMFIFNDSRDLAWFPSRATHNHRRYFLFGVLCGLALYNQCIIHLPFSMALFKKLLGVKPSLEDLVEFSPCVGRGLLSILEEYGDKEFESLELPFSISWDGTDVDIDPQNPEKTVTSQNKKEFVDAYINHAFNTSVAQVFREFKRGFFAVSERDLVKQLQPQELQEVLVGKDFGAWESLKQNAVYNQPYHVNHPNIQMFWEVFDDLTEDQKKKFLWFVTGFERLPILGHRSITIRPKEISQVPKDQYYPESLTCHSILELPMYSTKEILKVKLTEALNNSRRNYG